MNLLIKNVEGSIAKQGAAKKQAAKQRHVYTTKFKVQVIEVCGEEGATQDIIAEKFGISQSEVSRWMIKRRDIMKDASSKHRKFL